VIFIDVDEKYGDLLSPDLLQEAARTTLQQEGLQGLPSLSIKITGEGEIQRLNAAYRGKDQATDVLSFEADYFDPDLETRYLGDVVISYPTAAEQARDQGHAIEAELQLLVVHGLLHLLGYDHHSPQQEESMWKIQNQVLARLGLESLVEDEE